MDINYKYSSSSTTTLKNTRLSENRAERAKEKIANEIFR